MTRIKVTDPESFEAASARLEKIWSARPGDPDFEERAALVAEINAYEEREDELPPPDPVDAILFRMEQAGLQQKDLVEYIGSPRPRSPRCWPQGHFRRPAGGVLGRPRQPFEGDDPAPSHWARDPARLPAWSR